MKCPVCERKVKNKRGLSVHMSHVHPEEWLTGKYSISKRPFRTLVKPKGKRTSKKAVSSFPGGVHETPPPPTPEQRLNHTLIDVIGMLLTGYKL